MRTYLFLCLLIFVLFACQNENKMEIHEKKAGDSLACGQSLDTARFTLSSFLGLDSVANSDFYFMDSVVDSITTEKLAFEATYIYCYKALVHQANYRYFQTRDPSEYKSIMAIHTEHLLVVNGKEYSFNGKGDIGCSRSIPENTMVSIDSKVYSFFSNRKGLGKLVVLESIEKIK